MFFILFIKVKSKCKNILVTGTASDLFRGSVGTALQARWVEHFSVESFAATLRLWICAVAPVASAVAVVRLFVSSAFSFSIEAIV